MVKYLKIKGHVNNASNFEPERPRKHRNAAIL